MEENLKKYGPMAAIGAVLIVVLLLASRSNSGGSVPSYPTIANLGPQQPGDGSLSEILAQERVARSQLAGDTFLGLLEFQLASKQDATDRLLGLEEIGASRTVSLADIASTERLGLAQTESNLQLGLAQLTAEQQVALQEQAVLERLGLRGFDVEERLGIRSLDVQQQLGLSEDELQRYLADVNFRTVRNTNRNQTRQVRIRQQGETDRADIQAGVQYAGIDAAQSIANRQSLFNFLGRLGGGILSLFA